MINNNLKEIAEILNIRFPNAEFSKNLGFSKGVVSEYLNDKKRISGNFVEQFENFYKVSYEKLVLKVQSDNHSKVIVPTENQQQGKPLIPIDAVAGFGTGDNEGIAYEQCDHYIVPDFDKRGMDFLIRVSGSSMYPKYSNGDVLACKKVYEITFFQWGKVYVIDSNQGALVKRIFEDKDNPDNVLCVSDNKQNYPPFSMPKKDIRSLSIVLGVVRME